jgi:CHAT domain-containing protein/tetratricopeptide (TPR) repeat protein
MRPRTSLPVEVAAELERLEATIRREEYERLTPAALDPGMRERAAGAYAGLAEYFLLADVAERTYDTDHRQVEALDQAVEAIEALRRDVRWSDLAIDRQVGRAGQAVRILRERYEVTGQPADLVRALEFAEEAVRLARGGAPAQLATALRDLGEQLAALFDRDVRCGEIDRAVDVLREADELEAAGRPGERRSAGAVPLAAALLLRAKALGSTADLDEAVRALRQALDDQPDSPRALDALGCVLITRAEQTESAADLDAAVGALERATALAPDDPWFGANLAVALRARFTASGDREDARHANALFAKALAAIPESSPDRLRILQNAGAGRAAEPTATDLLTQARMVVEATPPTARARPARLGALAGRLIDAFQENPEPATIGEAIAVSEEGLRLASQASVDRPSLLGGLAYALLLSYALLGTEDHLARAIATAREALETAPDASPERAGFALILGQAWSLRAGRTGAPTDLNRASEAFRLAADLGRRHDPGAALRAGRMWGEWAAEEGRWPEAAEALQGALAAAEDLYRRQVGRRDREAWLKLAPGLAAAAASASARIGDAEQAVLALERGSARMLADSLDRDRAELDRLGELGHAALATRFAAAAAELTARERHQDATAQYDERGLAEARAALDAVVAEIRALPGLARFLAPATLAEVVAAGTAAGGPVVYLATGAIAGVVAAVRGDGSAVVRVLDELGQPTAYRQVGAFVDAHRRRASDPGGWRTELSRTSDWLGTAVWPAILDAAGPCDRIVLVPGGVLGLLPLHAAARPDPAAPTGRRYALDDLLISYAPNARALQAGLTLAARVPGHQVLAVGAAEHAGERPLEYGEREAAAIRAAFGEGRHIPADQATRAEVLAALAEFDVLHFACHGRADIFDPLAGALLLAGSDELTVRDVLGLRLPGARLAVLSACESAIAGAALPEEVIGLPTGLLQAGCAGVVGSLWQVPDASTLMLMRRFVHEWRQNGTAPAEALRRAQRWVRDATNRERQAAYPDAPGLGHLPADPRLRDIWAGRRAYAHPHDWAAFAYIGA